MRKTALFTLLGSIGLAAALGCWAILASDLGWLGVRVLLTSITVSAASLLIMACGAALERRPPSWAARPGVGLALLTAALWITGIWTEPDEDVFWKSLVPLTAFAIVAAHASLLSFARLTPAFQLVRWTAAGLTVLLALLVTYMAWAEQDSDELVRVLGVLSILAAAASIAVPVCHRLSRERTGGAGAGEEAGFCPRCGEAAREAEHAEPRVCRACGARYRVVFTDDANQPSSTAASGGSPSISSKS